MLSRICFPPDIERSPWGRFGLVGISPLNHRVYLWQLHYGYNSKVSGFHPTQSKLVLWTVNPVVPSSWEEHPLEVIVKKWIKVHASELSYCYSQIMFHYNVYKDEIPVAEELILVDLIDGQTQSYPSSTDFVSENVLFNRKRLIESFPQLRKPAILTLDERRKTNITFTKDQVFYYAGDERSYNQKFVAYDMKNDVSLEGSLHMMTGASLYMAITPIGSPEAAYLAVNQTRPHGHSSEVYQIKMLHNRIALNTMIEIPNVCIGHGVSTVGDPAACGDGKVVVLHGIREHCKFLTAVCVNVPTLKYIATFAVQKIFGTFGSKGEMVTGIDENDLMKMIGCQNKLF